MRRPVLIVVGPTASGKSALALDLARRLDGVVINADSMQIYAELAVLTARPSAADAACVPHALYGVRSGREACSAAIWRDLALREIRKAHANAQVPVLTGGTGFYVDTLLNGIAPVPEVPDAVRRAAAERLDAQGGAAFHGELAKRDPATAARLDPGNTQRLIRAWAVIEATGRPLSDWHARPAIAAPADLRFRAYALMPPRADLYERCDDRFRRMIDRGALEEVETLRSRAFPPASPILKAVGVREIGAYQDGEIGLDEAIRRAQRATRRYAKRQSTWFRNRIDPDVRLSGPASRDRLSALVRDARDWMASG